MFENLRAAFREAVENFKEELNRDQVPEAVDRLLYGMKQEVTEAKTRLHDLEQAIERTRAEVAREVGEIQTCERRERMAREIGDEETARVAGEFLEKHRERKQVLEEKEAALKKELALRTREIEEMLNQIREAQKGRDALAAQVGRSSARESIRESQDLFDELDRMAEKIGDTGRRSEAAEEIYRDTAGEDWDADLGVDQGPSRPEPDVDARLRELKRRMGKE